MEILAKETKNWRWKFMLNVF